MNGWSVCNFPLFLLFNVSYCFCCCEQGEVDWKSCGVTAAGDTESKEWSVYNFSQLCGIFRLFEFVVSFLFVCLFVCLIVVLLLVISIFISIFCSSLCIVSFSSIVICLVLSSSFFVLLFTSLPTWQNIIQIWLCAVNNQELQVGNNNNTHITSSHHWD